MERWLLSEGPSVWGVEEVDLSSLVTRALWSCNQRWPVNVESQHTSDSGFV